MAQIKNVSGTAFVVAEFRAEENDAAQPFISGPHCQVVVTVLLNQ